MEDTVRPKELEPWVREALKVQINAAEKAARKARSDIDAQVASVKEVVTDLLRKSEKGSTEKRDDRAAYKAARAVGRMCLELQDLLSAPLPGDTETYEGLKQFSDVASRLASDSARVRDKWVRHIRPYYILDMISLSSGIDKIRRLSDQSWEVFSREGTLLHRLEEIQSRVQKIDELERSLHEQLDERNQVIEEIKRLEPQISQTERLIESLTTDTKITELRKIDNRLKELRGELLTSGFRRLGRPLRKLEAMASRGEYPVPPEVREKLSEYLKRPFTTFVHEAEGYPFLKSVLRSMQNAVEKRKLLLKQREERKVLERIENVVEKDILDRIHREATALLAERRKCLQDPACVDLVSAYKQKKRDLKILQSKRTDLEHRSRVLGEKVGIVRDALAHSVNETALLAERLAKRPVKVTVDLESPQA